MKYEELEVGSKYLLWDGREITVMDKSSDWKDTDTLPKGGYWIDYVVIEDGEVIRPEEVKRPFK